jgi:hypothetical protein
LLIADGLADPHFFTVPPPGEIPTSWSVAPTGSNGVFTIALLFQDSTNPNHFGVTSNYSVSGGFTIDSASGSFLTPEPGTVVLVAIGLVVAFRARSAQSGEAATKARHAST